MDLGGFALSQGDFSRARALWEERLALSEEIGDKDGIAMSLAQLGQLAAQQGHRGRAISLTKGSLVVAHELGQKNSIAYLLEHLAYFARGQSQQQRAVCLLGAAQVLRENMNSPVGAGSVLADEEAEYNHTVATARVALSDEGFAKVWAEGQTMTLEEAVAYALKED
jgi:tetratricopeptide (TPR) repeat protein